MFNMKVFAKKSLAMVLSFMLLLLAPSFFVVKAAQTENSINGVNVTITTDKDNYSVDTIGNPMTNVTVNLENTNPYSVTVSGAELSSKYFFLANVSDKLPERIILDARGSKSYTLGMVYTFEQWRELPFYNQRTKENEVVRIGFLASFNAVEPNWKFVADCHDITEDEHDVYSDMLDSFDEDDHAAHFSLGLTNDNGDSVQPKGPIKLFLPVPNGYTPEEWQAVHVEHGEDEQFIEKIETVAGDQYITIITDHFGPYALVNPEETEGEINNPSYKGETGNKTEDTKDSVIENQNKVVTESESKVKTGDKTKVILIPLTIITIVCLVLSLVMGKKCRSAALVLVICIGFGSTSVLAKKIESNKSETKLTTQYNDFVKRVNENSSDTESKDHDLTVSFTVTYDGPEFHEDLVVDSDNYPYGSYYEEFFNLKIVGGQDGWIGNLYLLNESGTVLQNIDIDFAQLIKVDDYRIFNFAPGVNFEDGKYILQLVDKHGNSCDKVSVDLVEQ